MKTANLLENISSKCFFAWYLVCEKKRKETRKTKQSETYIFTFSNEWNESSVFKSPRNPCWGGWLSLKSSRSPSLSSCTNQWNSPFRFLLVKKSCTQNQGFKRVTRKLLFFLDRYSFNNIIPSIIPIIVYILIRKEILDELN